MLNIHNALPVRLTMLVVVLFAVLALAACGGDDTKDPLELVPARANALGSADLPTILNDTDVETAFGLIAAEDPEGPQTLAALLAEAESDFGVDLTSTGTVVVFADLSDGADYVGFLAAGEFDRDEIFAAIRAANLDETYIEETYNDEVMLVVDANDDQDDEASAIVAGAFVIGSVDAVRDVIDVAGGAAAVGGELLAFYEGLGDVWAKIVLAVPADAADDLGDTGALGLPIDLGSLLEVEMLGVVGTKDGDDAVVRLVAGYATEALATETAETLDALLTLLPNLIGDDSLSGLTDGLTVTSSGSQATLEFRSSIQEALENIDSAADTLGGSAGLGL
jgi:predicted small lipoprotein YifL